VEEDTRPRRYSDVPTVLLLLQTLRQAQPIWRASGPSFAAALVRGGAGRRARSGSPARSGPRGLRAGHGLGGLPCHSSWAAAVVLLESWWQLRLGEA